MRRLSLLFLLFLIIYSGYAQKICGRVTSAEGEPMPYATVFIESLNQGTISNENGHYTLDGIKSGRYKVKASFIGHKTQIADITISDSDGSLDFVMPEESVTLSEVIVLPGDMDICSYIITQIDKNRKPLKKLLNHYDCYVTSRFHKDMDLSNIKRRRTIRFALSMVGWGKIFDTMIKYPSLTVRMGENTHFNKGNISNDGLQILETNPTLTDKEIQAFKNKDWFLDANSYDKFYDMVHDGIKQVKKKKNNTALSYYGSYEEDNRTIFILKYGNAQIEVVDECWQIRRIKYKNGPQNLYFEFYEAHPNVFLPISGSTDIDINAEKRRMKGTVKLGISYKYSGVR